MSNKILLNAEAYMILRRDSRDALGRIGIGSNPLFTDYNIFTGLSEKLGVETPEMYDESSEYRPEMFRDSLACILGLEIPVNVSDIRDRLSKIQRP
jgi:hypothetical protein